MNINGITDFKDYKIIRSHFETSYITQLELEKLSCSLEKHLGYCVDIAEDAYVEESGQEIVVGGCNRQGLENITDRDYWQIRVKGTKLYLEGGSDYSIAMAVTEFDKTVNQGELNFADGVFKSGSYKETIKNYNTSKYYKYVWGDEFDGPEIDPSKWYVCRPGTMDGAAFDGKKVHRSIDETTFIKDGLLYQVAKRTDDAYYGGFLRTIDIMHFKYGYIEIKQKTPQGNGFWTALWLNGSDYTKNGNISEGLVFPEIDVCEGFGDASIMRPTTHAWPTARGKMAGGVWAEHHESPYQPKIAERSAYCPDGKLFSDDFHTFGCLWTDKFVRFTCDGKPYYEVDTTQTVTDREALNCFAYINLSHAVMFRTNPLFNRARPEPPATEEEWANTNKYIVDYVHLWQLDGDSIRFFDK